MIEYNKQKISNALIITGIIFTLIFLSSLILLLSGPKIDEQLDTYLKNILKSPFLYQIGYIFAGLTGPITSILMLILILFVQTEKNTPLFNIFSVFFLAPYLVLVSIAYFSQSIYFINLLRINIEMAKEWCFGNFNSLSYFIQQLGYLFFALSGIFLGYRYCFDKGIKKIFGFFLEIRCMFTIIAFTGLILNNRIINYATLISGTFTIFFGVFAILIGINIKKNV